MTVDWDGLSRMDCSSPSAMARLVGLGNKDRFDVAFANDTDADRHGIVTPSAGPDESQPLSRGSNFLPVPESRGLVGRTAAVGKTVVSSSYDRPRDGESHSDAAWSRVPVGFKWFVDGLIGGSIGFGGEESAGASFLRRDGSVWTTDKDGIVPGLLTAEYTAKTGRDPGAH